MFDSSPVCERKILAIDESGSPGYTHASRHFILAGVIIRDDFIPELEESIGAVKKKYLRSENAVLHSKEILERRGSFRRLYRAPDVEFDFWTDLVACIIRPEIELSLVLVDKEKARKDRWNKQDILKWAYRTMLGRFVTDHLPGDTKGEIVAEFGSMEQSEYLLRARSYSQNYKLPACEESSNNKEKITSVSFVTKENYDVTVQVADIVATLALLSITNRHRNIQPIIEAIETLAKMERAGHQNAIETLSSVPALSR